MKAAFLSDRGVVKVAGNEARKFLNGLLTADMGKVGPGRPGFAGLLTPQGKIIVDFIVAEAADASFLFDCPRALAPALAERLAFYKLRAKLTIEDQSASLHVIAAWNDASAAPPATAAAGDLCFPDPRHAELGMRCISPLPPAEVAAALGATLVEASAYERHRIVLGVPSGGLDFAYGDAFPHEADMDQLNGIDFKKGCFVGQEVVSRMEHRGLARTRVVPVALTGAAPVVGTAVTAGGKPVGVMGAAAGSRALAALRLDRVEEALAGGQHLRAGDAELKLVKPAWARFAFPGEPKAAE